MQWDVNPTGARIAQLANDLTARIEALDPESDTPVYSDFSFAIAVADWTLANGVYIARVNNTVLLTENAGIQVFYDASLRNYLVGDIFADKHTGYVDFTTSHLPIGSISGIIRVLDSVSGTLSVSRGGTGGATPKQARESLNVPIRDIPIDFGTVSSLPQTIYDADITANMIAFDATFGNPAAVPGGIDVTFAAGSVTISGTMTSGQSTTIKFWAHEPRSAVEGTETGSTEPRVNDFVQVGAQTLTAAQQAQIRTNLGAASASDFTIQSASVTPADESIFASNNIFLKKSGNIVSMNGWAKFNNAPNSSVVLGTIPVGFRPKTGAIRSSCAISDQAYNPPKYHGYFVIGEDGSISLKAPSENSYTAIYLTATYIAEQ